jgi:tetratricopeptide (TPR) repeat protein
VDLARTDRPELLAVYLGSIDTISHLFIRDVRHGRQAIERAYRDADTLLMRIARASAPDSLVLVCSDHGFYPATAAVEEDPANLAGPATAWHRPYGIVAVSTAGALATGEPSPAFGKGADAGLITPLDVAPTLLHAAGVAVSSEMPGHIIKALLPLEIAARAPVRALPPKFSPPPLDGLVRADADDTRDRLRALGYVGAVTTSLARQNLGESLFRRGKYAAAERELRAVLEAQPQNVAAQLWLAQTLVKTGHPRDALVVYERAMPLPGGAKDALIEATDVAVANGDLAAARRMIGLAPAGAFIHVARGALAEAQHQMSAAQREYQLALDKDPTSFDALSRLFDLLTRTGRPREALSAAERASRLAPDSPRLLGLTGSALAASGDLAGAERTLTRALWLAPDADALRLALGRALFAEHKITQAIDVVNQAGASPDRDILLGAAYSSSRDWRRAIEHLQQALDAGRATPDVLNALGWAQMQSGDRRAAATSFTRSLAAKPDQPDIRRLLADVQEPREGLRR